MVAPEEGHVFHNRLTHTLKVAQLSQRLTQRFLELNPPLARGLHLDSDVAEAAALAHDLGHPPFGHVAEKELRHLADSTAKSSSRCQASPPDGFEGNAQSFRIITRLAFNKPEQKGLDLSRATLNAVLKYPHFRESKDSDRAKWRKYGAYRSDSAIFHWVRRHSQKDLKSPEAQVMDWADEITYSVHDLDDFVRAGLIPIGHLLIRTTARTNRRAGDEFEGFIGWWKDWLSRKELDGLDINSIDEAEQFRLQDRLEWLYGQELYTGAPVQRGMARQKASEQIDRFVSAIQLVDPEDHGGEVLALDDDMDKLRLEKLFLQGLVWKYVITNEKLKTQQQGQRAVIRGLYKIYLDAVCTQDESVIPSRYYYELAEATRGLGTANPSCDEIRLAVDIVSGFSDQEAVIMYRRLTGIAPGSLLDLQSG